jgi:hypothetical protein
MPDEYKYSLFAALWSFATCAIAGLGLGFHSTALVALALPVAGAAGACFNRARFS